MTPLLFLLILTVITAGCLGTGGNKTPAETTTQTAPHTFVIHLTTQTTTTTETTTPPVTTSTAAPTNTGSVQGLPSGTPLQSVPIFVSNYFSELQKSIAYISSQFTSIPSAWAGDADYLENTEVIRAINNNYILPYYLAPRSEYTLAFIIYVMPNSMSFTIAGAYDRGVFIAQYGLVIDLKYYVQELEEMGTVAAVYLAPVKDGTVAGVTKYAVTDFLTPQYFGDEYSFTLEYYYTDTNGTYISLAASVSASGTTYAFEKTLTYSDPDYTEYMTVNGDSVTDVQVLDGGTTSTEYKYHFSGQKPWPEFALLGFVPVYIGPSEMIAAVNTYSIVAITAPYNGTYYSGVARAAWYTAGIVFSMSGSGTSFVDTVTPLTVERTAYKSTLDFSDVQTIIRYVISNNDYLLSSYILANFGELDEIIGTNSYFTMTNYGFGPYVMAGGIFYNTVLPFFANTTVATYTVTAYYPDGSVKDFTTVISYTPPAHPVTYSFDGVVNGTHIVQSGVYYPDKSLVSEVVVSNGTTFTTEAHFTDSLPIFMIPAYVILGPVRSDSEYIYAGPGIFDTVDIMVLHGTLTGNSYVGKVYDYVYGDMDFSLNTGTFTLSVSS